MASSNLHVFYQNTRGLRTKINIFSNNVIANDYDIIGLTETWLNQSILSNELFTSRYNVFRRDRVTSQSLKGDGGGSLIAVKNNLPVTYHPELSSDAEDIWISIIDSNSRQVFICCIYLPGHDDYARSCFISKLAAIWDRLQNRKVLILGDFNMPLINWVEMPGEPYFQPTNVDKNSSEIVDQLVFCELMQFNNIGNTLNRKLDLILCNKKCIRNLIKSSSPLIVPEDPAHPALEFFISYDFVRPLNDCCQQRYNFKNAPYVAINNELRSIGWSELLQKRNMECSLDIFYSKIYSVMDRHIPRQIQKSNRFPIYFKPITIRTIKEKNKTHKKWKKFGDFDSYTMYRNLRSRSKQLITKDYQDFINNTENNITSNNKHFWKFVSQKKGCDSAIPASVTYNGINFEGGKDICSAFKSYFSSIYLQTPNNAVLVNDTDKNCSSYSIYIGKEKILQLLSSLDVNKGPGPDGLSPLFLKNCAEALYEPLYILYNKSLHFGYVPTKWKNSYIVPIFKGGMNTDVKNYRPISKLNILAKLLEKFVYDIIFCEVRGAIIQEQHGFHPNRSVETNLLCFSEYVTGALDAQWQVDAIYTDFSKAFDLIDQNLLINKLSEAGVDAFVCRWVSSYICGRSSRLSVLGYKSDSFQLTTGVPQGSHLGPLLFDIFINSVKSCFLHSRILVYADDMKIFKLIKSNEDCQRLQEDLQRFAAFCNDNSLILNVNKCYKISFTRNRNIFYFNYILNDIGIKVVSEIRDLGVIVDSKWTFAGHVEQMVSSALKMLGFIKRTCKDFKNSNSLLALYYAFIYSKLQFAAPVWSPGYNVYVDRIERVQKKFMRFLSFKFHIPVINHDYSDVRSRYGLLQLHVRRKMSDFVLLFKLLNNLIDSPELLAKIKFYVPTRHFRDQNLFMVPYRRTNLGYNSPICRILRNFNDYNPDSIDLYSMSLPLFKRKIRRFFVSLDIVT